MPPGLAGEGVVGCAGAGGSADHAGRGGGDLTADPVAGLDQSGQFRPGHGHRQVPQPAVRADHEPLRRHRVQCPADPSGHDVGRLYLLGLDVEHTHPQDSVPAEPVHEPQVVVALAGELEQQLVDPGRQDGREQEVVVPFPQRPGVPVPVADVQGPGDGDVLGDQVDRLDGEVDLLGIAGQEGLVDLQQVGPRGTQGPGLGVQHPGHRPDQVGVIAVGLVVDPPGERERSCQADLDPAVGVRAGEGEVLDQSQRAGVRLRQRGAHHHIEVVEGDLLDRSRDLDPRHPCQQVVDVVVPTQLAVRDDIQAGELLVLQRGLDCHVVHLVQLGAADPAVVVRGLGLFQPGRNRVRADHGRSHRVTVLGGRAGRCRGVGRLSGRSGGCLGHLVPVSRARWVSPGPGPSL
jgi:hypothetical protein